MVQSRIKQIMSKVVSGTPASQIIRTLSQHGGMTAAQIARHTGLARSTISTAVSELKDSHVVVEIEQTATGSVGRTWCNADAQSAGGYLCWHSLWATMMCAWYLPTSRTLSSQNNRSFSVWIMRQVT